MKIDKPLFIVVEGGDGAGKGTQIKMLKSFLESSDYQVTVSREPGGSEIGEKIRGIMKTEGGGEKLCPVAELTLFITGRIQHAEEVIKPFQDLRNSKTALILDRFFPSTWAYQMCARGLRRNSAVLKMYRSHVEILRDSGCVPDIAFFFDLDPKIAEDRLKKRADEEMGFDKKDMEFKKRVRRGFQDLFEKPNILGFNATERIIVDASGTPDEVHGLVSQELKRFF